MGLIADRYSAAKREQRLLRVAYEAGVVEDLLRDCGEHSQRRAWLRLTEDFVIEPEAARMTVAALCGVLGQVVMGLHSNSNKPKPVQAKAPEAPQPINPTPAQLKVPKTPQPTPPTVTLISGRYRDNGDGTVTDIQTGLQWMRCSLGHAWSQGACIGEYKTFTFVGAAQAATDLNRAGGYAGYLDWRVPARGELETLIKLYGRPSIDDEAFPNTPTTVYWSSSPYANDSRLAWSANFYNGHSYSSYRSYNGAVRLVRNG